MSIGMNGKSLLRHYCFKKNNCISTLNVKDVTDADYMHAKTVCKDEFHNLPLKNNALLLANVFESFRKMCLKIYHLDFAKCLSAPVLAWQAALKKTEVN